MNVTIGKRLALITLTVLGMFGSFGLLGASTASAAPNHFLSIAATYRIYDNDGIWDSSEVKEGTQVMELQPQHGLYTDWKQIEDCADEVRGVLDVHARAKANDAIIVEGYVYYYEGTNCGTTDLHNRQAVYWEIPPGEETSGHVFLSDGDGNIEFWITLRDNS